MQASLASAARPGRLLPAVHCTAVVHCSASALRQRLHYWLVLRQYKLVQPEQQALVVLTAMQVPRLPAKPRPNFVKQSVT
jgi:hypothetical protein